MNKFEEKLNDMTLCLENVKQLYKSEIKDYGKIAESLKKASLNLMNLAVMNLNNLLSSVGEIEQDEKI